MKGLQLVIVLVCAALGFGITNNLLNALKKRDPGREDEPDDRSPS